MGQTLSKEVITLTLESEVIIFHIKSKCDMKMKHNYKTSKTKMKEKANKQDTHLLKYGHI